MGPRRTPSVGNTNGNFIAEWFGHRVWPTVDTSYSARESQAGSLCPFLSRALRVPTKCIKTASRGAPTGVCTISSDSNGQRQDWLACPYRTLDQHFTLLTSAISTAFGLTDLTTVVIVPITTLHEPTFRREIERALHTRAKRVFVFSADKLGGEVDLPETASSPGSKVDISVIEIIDESAFQGEAAGFGQHLFYEIQTADFHGSPLHAVDELRKLCGEESHDKYHEKLSVSPEIAGTAVEGPNKSNIFKRTIYQLILKIQLALHPQSVGLVLVLPLSVWESWLRHLGKPELRSDTAKKDLKYLDAPHPDSNVQTASSWIFVFDIDRASTESPQPLVIKKRIATTSLALMQLAFERAAEQAKEAGVIDKFRGVLGRRVAERWNKYR